MKKIYAFLVLAMMTTCVFADYYIKNNWGGGANWTWETMTAENGGADYTYTGVFGGTGVNINTVADDEGAAWFEKADITGSFNAGDEVKFTYNVASKKVSAVVVTPGDPSNVTYYIKNNWGGAADWTWEEMTPNADKSVWTYTGEFGGTGVNVNSVAGDGGAKWFELSIEVGKTYVFTYTVATESLTVKGEGEQGGQGGEGEGQGGQGGQGTGDFGDGYFYLKGYVNNADVEGLEDWNLFEGGMLAYNFTAENNYVFVIYQVDGEMGVQYMTNTPNNEACPASPATLKAWNQGNKMYVPGGQGTLYLYDNGDGTLTLSTTAIPGKTLVGGNQAQGVEHVAAKAAVTKTIENGQVVIVRGGVRYSAMGAKL